MERKFELIMDGLMAVVTWIAGIVGFYWIVIRWILSMFNL
jgi:hypothetical protein